MLDMNKFYVTTPIYYVNDKPHIGHAYTTITADIIARYYRNKGYDVKFVTGVDENSQKTVNAAASNNEDIKVYLDRMANSWKSTWDQLGISYDTFIRTTATFHEKGVLDIIKRVNSSGDLYKDKYEGFYCVGCESFKKESELVDGLCPLHNKKPDWIFEENYFFKLQKYQERLLEHINSHSNFIQPESRRNEIVSFINHGLQDFSVSRSTQKWGIPWPDEDNQVVYVWFDALTNYLTAVGYPDEEYKKYWPADLHVIGKDIIKFHCIYWPAMLMSAGIELPEHVFAHGFFMIDGQKISKSLGNAIDPIDLIKSRGSDALRYYLFSEISFGEDGEFSTSRFEELYSTELSNNLGNLVQRIAVLASKHLGPEYGSIPTSTIDSRFYEEAMESLNLTVALKQIWSEVRKINLFLQDNRPWEVVKTDKEEFARIMKQAISNVLLLSRLLKPFLPDSSDKIQKTFSNGKINLDVGLLFPQNTK